MQKKRQKMQKKGKERKKRSTRAEGGGSCAGYEAPNIHPPPRGEPERGLSFHMYPDRDLPGERLFLQLQRVLPSLVHHQLPPDCKDFSDLYLKLHHPNPLPP